MEIAEEKVRRSTVLRRTIRWIHRRRPLLTALVVLAALPIVLVGRAEPTSMLPPFRSTLPFLAWLLVIAGVAVRIWGSGNLRKNQEITEAGAYSVIRHPLYFGSLCIFLAYFLCLAGYLAGLAFFLTLVGLVYLPTMLAEEEHLMLKFPDHFAQYSPPPRLLPAFHRLPGALSSDRFGVGEAYRNLGLRSLWVIPGLPLLLEILRWWAGVAG